MVILKGPAGAVGPHHVHPTGSLTILPWHWQLILCPLPPLPGTKARPSSDHLTPQGIAPGGLPSSVHLGSSRVSRTPRPSAAPCSWHCAYHVHQPLPGLRVSRGPDFTLRGAALLLGPELDRGPPRSQPSGFTMKHPLGRQSVIGFSL